MAKYEEDEILTYWFIIYEARNGHREIHAYTDDKDMLKAYLDFHNCPNFIIKKVTDRARNFSDVIAANNHAGISIVNIKTRDPKAKKGKNKLKSIPLPLTGLERIYVDDDTETFLASDIGYNYINSAMHYLKDKYVRILEDIMLTDVIRRNQRQGTSKRLGFIEVDQLLLLLRVPNAHFGF